MSDQEVQAKTPAPTSTKKAIAIALIAAIAGGGAGSLVLGPKLSRPAAKPVAAEDTARNEGAVHLIENLVLNPAGTNGTRFLMAAIAIETKSSVHNDRMNKRDAELRDVVLSVLGARTIDQLATLAEREPLKKEVMDSVNAMFGPGAARSVWFPQFVIQ